jgi:hypothetical protein
LDGKNHKKTKTAKEKPIGKTRAKTDRKNPRKKREKNKTRMKKPRERKTGKENPP